MLSGKTGITIRKAGPQRRRAPSERSAKPPLLFLSPILPFMSDLLAATGLKVQRPVPSQGSPKADCKRPSGFLYELKRERSLEQRQPTKAQESRRNRGSRRADRLSAERFWRLQSSGSDERLARPADGATRESTSGKGENFPLRSASPRCLGRRPRLTLPADDSSDKVPISGAPQGHERHERRGVARARGGMVASAKYGQREGSAAKTPP